MTAVGGSRHLSPSSACPCRFSLRYHRKQMNTHPRLPILFVLLAGALLAGCGGRADGDPVAEAPSPKTVDPAELEADVEVEPVAPAAEVLPWTPVIEAVPANQFSATLRAAAQAVEAGQLLTPEASTLPAELDEAAEETPGPGALELYLGVLATDPSQAKAAAGVDTIVGLLLVQGRAALAEGGVDRKSVV